MGSGSRGNGVQSRRAQSLEWEARTREGGCPGLPAVTYGLGHVTAIVGPPEVEILEAKAAGEGAGQQDRSAVDSVDGGGLSHRYLQRQGHGEQEETCVRGMASLNKTLQKL